MVEGQQVYCLCRLREERTLTCIPWEREGHYIVCIRLREGWALVCIRLRGNNIGFCRLRTYSNPDLPGGGGRTEDLF